jgi:hypothetical protein
MSLTGTRARLASAGLALVLSLSGADSHAERLPMNQVQVVGSHNSYKLPIDAPLLGWLLQKDARRYQALDYSHVTLTRQLELGLRNLELDVVYDPEGGRFAAPLGLKLAQEAGGQEPAAYDPQGKMKRPGFKVLHVPDIDFRSSVYTFQDALRELLAWSNAHPRHLPVAVTMNAKDSPADIAGGVIPLSFDGAAFDAWDAEIRAVLPPERLLTPDDVRGRYPTLEAAVRQHAWPSLARARGRFLFVLDEGGEKLETYVKGHPSLRGRVMFVDAAEGRPEAAFRIVNDPLASFHYIQELVRAGYLVRTRADADTKEARTGDYARMHAAFNSGAQYVTTDYYLPNPAFGAGYRVTLPGGGAGRWNPVLAPPIGGLPSPE